MWRHGAGSWSVPTAWAALVREADLSVMQCPCCPDSHITSSCFRAASDVVQNVVGPLLQFSLLLSGGAEAPDGAH